MKLKPSLASRAGMTVLALSFIASNAAAAVCASPEEMSALRVSALRQQLMVAALQCHQAGSFNRFVTFYRGEFADSDRTLMQFFLRKDADRGDDGYNAFKTQQANNASLRSLSDPAFCRYARATFAFASSHNLRLIDLAGRESPLISTGFESCAIGTNDITEVSAVPPTLPQRHQDLLDDPAAVPTPAASNSGALAPEQVAKNKQAPSERQDGPVAPPDPAAAMPAEDDEYGVDNGPAPDMDAPSPDMDAPYAPAEDEYYNEADNVPFYAYPAYPSGWYGLRAPMRQVQGPDGRWYLVPFYAR